MANAERDGNFVPTLLAVSNSDGVTPVRIYADPVTHRLLVDSAVSMGTVTDVSVVTANGFAGTVANSTTTPAITLETTVTGILKGNGTAISAGTAGDVDSILPTQTGNSGKYLTTDGTNSSWASVAGGGITIGTTTIASGTDTRILYDNSGVVGEYTLTGTGTVVAMATSPTFQTSINGAYLDVSEILITDGSKNIVSAPVATYPSLTELSYVKGVTSAIQTQINAKGAGTVTSVSVATANGVSGSSSGGATPALTITLGAITPTTVNGNTFTTGSSTYTGTAGQTYTFPSTTATIARTDAAQTFTGIQTIPQIVNTPLAATVSSNAATITRASRINNFTNSSAATMAITLSTSGALDGDLLMVRIYDFSAVAQTIGWTNTEDSTVTAPTTSNGSTTLPLTVGFQYNGSTSKWRCIAKA